MKDEQVVSARLLRAVFESEESAALTLGVSTHDPARDPAARMVALAEDQKIMDVITALLPERYEGDTLKELPRMIDGARQKGFDKPEAASEAARKKARKDPDFVPLSELFDRSGAKLFHGEDGKGYACLPAENVGWINAKVKSSIVRQFVRKAAYFTSKRAIAPRDLDSFIETLEARAIFGSPKFETALRVGGDTRQVYHDLTRPDGAAVEIDANGWRITHDTATKMLRMEGMQSLPLPENGSRPNAGLDAFRSLLRLDDQAWVMILAFLVGAFRPKGPFACLSIQAEQGAGKSLLCELLKAIVDPAITSRLSMPDDERNLFIIANHHFLIVFDNLSGLKKDISDALCKLATGGGFSTRSLYTDDQLVTFSLTRPFAMNGISEFVHRPDLMDRTIPVHLEAMPEGARRSEEEIKGEFRAILPHILADLYTAVSCAIRNLPATPVPTELRMADAAQWLSAAEPALGLKEGTFVKVLKGRQDEALVDLATGDSLHAAMLALLEAMPEYEGPAADLLDRLRPSDRGPIDRFFPTTPAQLSAKLKRLRSSLGKAGINVEFPPRTHEGRRIKVTAGSSLRSELAKKPSKY